MNKKGKYLTLQIFTFKNLFAQLKAFTDMGRRTLTNRYNAPVFIQHMGSGAGEGFSLKPDFSTYALVAVWYELEAAQQHLNEGNYQPAWNAYCDENFQLLLQCTKVHGQWNGREILRSSTNAKSKLPIAVLTRARIKFSKLPRFWRHVPLTSKAIANAEGCIFSKGIGEWPLISLATISIWNSTENLQSFSYGGSTHGKIVRKVRKEGWFSEELFARFNIMDARGTYKGFSAKKLINATTQS